ncbi:MAG: hypothetical protein ACLGPM_07850 [Acidobacteriota bacterium]
MNEWTEPELKKLRELAGTMCGREVAAIIGRTRMATLRKISQLGLKGFAPGSPHGWTEKQFEMLRNVKPGVSIIQFARQIGKSDEAVRHWARKFGIKFVPQRTWTAEDVSSLRNMEERLTIQEAAEALHRTPRGVRAKAEQLGVKLRPKGRPKKDSPPRRCTPRKIGRTLARRRREPVAVARAVSRLEWCSQCHAPVSNWSQHFERMGHRRPAA